MSVSTLPLPRRRGRLFARSADFVQLTRPRIVAMSLAAAAAASCVARWGRPDLRVLGHTLLGVMLVAASGSAMNQWLERRRDSRMDRTAGRPLPAGRLSDRRVLAAALLAAAAGSLYLTLAVNVTTALWAAGGWAIYACVYTPLKSKTALSTTIGAFAGASPMLMGWHATGAAADLRLAALFSMLFLWQFPHFMAIAWLYREQYERAGLKMLTVVDPSGRLAAVQATSSALMLLPISLVPALFAVGAGAALYMGAACLLSVLLLGCAIAFSLHRTKRRARLLLRCTLAYLPSLLALIVLVHIA